MYYFKYQPEHASNVKPLQCHTAGWYTHPTPLGREWEGRQREMKNGRLEERGWGNK